jgi:hypothetical protein
MCKDTTNNGVSQEKNLFSFQDVLPDRKIQVDFNAPDISSNGGLVLVGLMKDSIARKIARLMENIKSLDPLLYSKLTHQKNIRIK